MLTSRLPFPRIIWEKMNHEGGVISIAPCKIGGFIVNGKTMNHRHHTALPRTRGHRVKICRIIGGYATFAHNVPSEFCVC